MTRLSWFLAIIAGLFVAATIAAAVLGWTDTPMQSCGTACAEAAR